MTKLRLKNALKNVFFQKSYSLLLPKEQYFGGHISKWDQIKKCQTSLRSQFNFQSNGALI